MRIGITFIASLGLLALVAGVAQADEKQALQAKVEALEEEVKTLNARVAQLEAELAEAKGVQLKQVGTKDVVHKGTTPPVTRVGGPGGDTEFTVNCMDGKIPVGLWGSAGRLIDSVGLVCRDPDTGEIDRTDIVGGNGGQPYEVTCADGERLSGVSGRAGMMIDQLSGTCVAANGKGANTEAVGGSGGDPFTLGCPDGKAFVGLNGRYGSIVGSVELICD